MFLYFYCLPMKTTFVLFFLAIGLWIVFNAFICKGLATSAIGRMSMIGGLVLWHIVILYITVFSRSVGIREAELLPFNQIITVLNGGNPEIIRSAWMNILLFVPLGVLYPEVLPEAVGRWKKSWLVVALACGLSIGIEVIQWTFALGLAEVDDVLCNVLGAVTGLMVYRLKNTGIIWIGI